MSKTFQKQIFIYIVFFLSIIAFLIFEMVRYLKKARKYKEKIMSLKESDLSKTQFEKNIEIKCDFCDNTFNSTYKTCPNCGGAYNNNKGYLEYLKNSNTEYYKYLEYLQNDIKEKFATYCKVARDLKRNFFVNHSLFNYTIPIPSRQVTVNVEIFCEYCGTKIDLNLNNETSCPNCGSSCIENMELKAYKKKNEIIELEREKYRELNDIIKSQNQKNGIFDSYLTHKNWYAKLVILLVFVLPIIPAYFLGPIIPYSLIGKSLIVLSGIGEILTLLIIYRIWKWFSSGSKKE